MSTELANEILKACYVSPTAEKTQLVIEVLEDTELESPTTQGTEICDALGIARRENRSAIANIINKYNEDHD
jgi:hypothetical protein